jgi:hypothetical protein
MCVMSLAYERNGRVSALMPFIGEVPATLILTADFSGFPQSLQAHDEVTP